jgi:hypothetical protein
MSGYPRLPCETTTYRAILYPNLRDKAGLPRWQNFKLRKNDRDGASLGLTHDRCIRDLTTAHFGVLTVRIGRVRNASDATTTLDVIRDDPAGDPDHAVITGLPYLFDADGNPLPDFALNARAQHLAKRILTHVLEHIRKHPEIQAYLKSFD